MSIIYKWIIKKKKKSAIKKLNFPQKKIEQTQYNYFDGDTESINT